MQTPIASRLRRLAAVASALALAVTLAGCGPSPSGSPTGSSAAAPSLSGTGGPSPEPSVDATAVYGAIAAQVEQLRGLQPTTDVAPVLLDGDQLRANLTADFDKNNPPAVVRFTQELYVELGLLPAGASLRNAYLDLQSGQVIGYYSTARKQLFVVSRSGGIGPTQRVTYAHEFTHQLQDQQFDLAKLIGAATDQGDQAFARLGLIEGDAVVTQTKWMTANLTAADLAQLLADASDPAALAALQHAPAILRSTSLYPYTDGLAFVQALLASGGVAAVNAAFADPPDSTAQVLHPELYLNRVAPVPTPAPIELPSTLASSLGSGWTQLGEDTIGELQIRAWLAADGLDTTTAAAAAAGWAGDRVAILKGPGGQVALAMLTAWTNGADLAEFFRAYDAIAAKVPGSSIDGVIGDDRMGIVIAPTRDLAEALAAAIGI